MSDILSELRQAVRSLVKRPLFTLVATLSIGIGVGANTAMFSVFNGLLLRAPAGIGEPERVVQLGRTQGGGGFDSFTYRELQEMRALGGPLEQAAGVRTVALSLSSDAQGERAHALAVTHEYFDVLGARPALGRFFGESEDRVPGSAPVAVLSHAFWQDRFGGAADLVGRTISLNRQPFTVVGIAAEGFHGHIGLVRPDLYIPLSMMPVAQPGFDSFANERASWLLAIGRLAPGATVEQVNAALDGMIARLAVERPDYYERRGAAALPISSVPGGGQAVITAFLSVLMALVGLILLVTCANVAGMLVARAVAREREVVIRLALGAGRWRLIRQLMLESAVLFVLGGTLGLLFATWGAAALAGISIPTPFPIHFDFAPDARVFAFGASLAVMTGLLFGLAPALHSARTDLLPVLRNDSRAGASGGRLRRVFVAGQVALTVMLLLSAGLFLRALQRAGSIETGFSADGVAIIEFDLSIDGYDEAAGARFLQDVTPQVAAAPGIAAVGLTTDLPLDLSISESTAFPDNLVDDPESRGLGTAFAYVDGGYFDALAIRVLRGRRFDERDAATAEPAIVVSAEFARRAWPGADPIGRRVAWGDRDAMRTVIGVVADVKNQLLMEATEPMVYLPIAQLYRPEVALVARATTGASAAAASLRAAIQELDPRISLTPARSLAEFNALGLLPQRLAAAATVSFGLIALLLSALGVYGVVAFMVAQRTREIGVRMALGADARSVAGLVVGAGLRTTLPGAAIGAALGLGFAFLMRSFILGVAPADPVALVGAPVILMLAVLFACWLPAMRAASVDPVDALRSE